MPRSSDEAGFETFLAAPEVPCVQHQDGLRDLDTTGGPTVVRARISCRAPLLERLCKDCNWFLLLSRDFRDGPEVPLSECSPCLCEAIPSQVARRLKPSIFKSTLHSNCCSACKLHLQVVTAFPERLCFQPERSQQRIGFVVSSGLPRLALPAIRKQGMYGGFSSPLSSGRIWPGSCFCQLCQSAFSASVCLQDRGALETERPSIATTRMTCSSWWRRRGRGLMQLRSKDKVN